MKSKGSSGIAEALADARAIFDFACCIPPVLRLGGEDVKVRKPFGGLEHKRVSERKGKKYGSFKDRILGTLAVTGQHKKLEGFIRDTDCMYQRFRRLRKGVVFT